MKRISKWSQLETATVKMKTRTTLTVCLKKDLKCAEPPASGPGRTLLAPSTSRVTGTASLVKNKTLRSTALLRGLVSSLKRRNYKILRRMNWKASGSLRLKETSPEK